MAFNDGKVVIAPKSAGENAGEQLRAEAPRFQDGGTHDTEDRGFGSGIGVAQRGENDIEQMRSAEQQQHPQVPDFVQDNQPVQPQQDWQQMYGKSENEKGQWRRTAEEAMTELNQMRAERDAMRAVQPQQSQQPNYQPAYQPAQQPAQAAQQAIPETFFEDKEPGDLVEVKDVDAIIRSRIAPAVLYLNQQQIALQQQTVEAQKVAAGITPAIEQQMLAECPWMNGIPDGVQRIQAMQSYGQQKFAGQAQQQQQAPQNAQVSPQQAAARRVTYIESGQPAKPSESEVPLQQRIASEFAQANTAAEKKAVLVKYGMQQVNDWGSDVWGPAR